MRNQIIDIISENRICTTEICDAMDKSGALTGIRPVNSGMFAVGKVQYVFAHSGTNYDLHRQIEGIEEDSIVFVDSIECDGRAVFGDLVTKYLQLYKKARAIVTNGTIRDAHRIIKEQRPVWCADITPIGCHNKHIEVPDHIQLEVVRQKSLFDNAIMVCDDSGVALIPAERVGEELIEKLFFIEAQEDIWYFCVDTLKWSTYKTVALKSYMAQESVIPKVLIEKLKEYDL